LNKIKIQNLHKIFLEKSEKFPQIQVYYRILEINILT